MTAPRAAESVARMEIWADVQPVANHGGWPDM